MTTSSPKTSDIADKSTRFAVLLNVDNFQVTATNRLNARKYPADDAREFLPNWNFLVGIVRPAVGETLTCSIENEPITIQVKDSTPEGDRERLYMCDASITITVDASDGFFSGEVALHRVCDPARLSEQIEGYRDKVFWDKLLRVARGPFDQMAEVLRRRGFDAAVSSNTHAGSQSLAIEVAESGERLGLFTLVKCFSAASTSEPYPPPNS